MCALAHGPVKFVPIYILYSTIKSGKEIIIALINQTETNGITNGVENTY
jgi:hypothetical protein